MRGGLPAIWIVLATAMTPVLAQVFDSEFVADPVSEGWSLVLQSCEPTTWSDRGWYYQQLDLEACPNSHPSGRDVYRRSLQSYNTVKMFFLEYRLQTDGDQSEIPGGSPSVVAMGNFLRCFIPYYGRK